MNIAIPGIASLCLALFASGAAAQAYPAKPIRMVVPYAAGGLPDTITRVVGQRLAEQLGQQIVVENRPGAGGISGCEQVAKSPADGYTLLIGDVGQVSINQFLYRKLPYDPDKDLVPVSLIATSALFLVAHPSLAVNNFNEMVALARAKPGSINYGSSGTGSIHHLATEAIKAGLGIDLVHIPYKGTGQSVPALLGGQVSLLYSALPSIESQVKAGKVKLLAVSTARRSPQEPNVPTVAEVGIPGYAFTPEIGVLAPTGTPQAIIDRVASEIARAVRHPETAKRLQQLGIDPVGSSPAEYAAVIRASSEKYAKVVRFSGAKVD